MGMGMVTRKKKTKANDVAHGIDLCVCVVERERERDRERTDIMFFFSVWKDPRKISLSPFSPSKKKPLVRYGG